MTMKHITPMKMKRRSALFALTSVVLALDTVSASDVQTNATAPAPIPTQVIILGTLHGSHEANTNYSLEVLRKIIVAVKPAAILVEQPPESGGRPTVRDGRATKPGRQRGVHGGEPGRG